MNKKITAFLFYLFLTIGAAQAQATLIPKAGVSFTKYKSENTFGNKIREFTEFGLVGGVALNLPLSRLPWLSVQPEILCLQKKYTSQAYTTFTYPFEAEVWFNKTSRTMHYVELPLLFKATKNFGQWQGNVHVGPALGYALAGKQTSGDVESKHDFNNNNRLEVSAQAGVGVGRRVGIGTLQVDARYSLGLTPLYKEQTLTLNMAPPSETPVLVEIPLKADQKSNVLRFTIGYAIPINASIF
ncbi:porin family protein [Sabulibacter ruber]|uniref:porin family protein n=1 Tax=Sabulibacter ruber TaxID=2811901 RepID=UPI001A9749A3|nr:porin family protein [Sabulibacter ruber]